jgi:NAD(P)-dependent dehydrogenase (short-subunit alcohol dehydrogenase family)
VKALVTGAAGGIGTAIVARLVADGYDVVGVDISGEGGTTACDVSDRAAVEALAAEVGRVDLLVNNAAIWRFAPLEDVNPGEFERVVAVNLFGPFYLTQAFGRLMVEAGAGSIVNVVSIAANHVSPYVGAYSSTKAALVALTRQTAYEWGPRGVRANAVGPGLIQTEGAGMYHDEAVVAGRAAAVPARRLGTGADIARVIAFLGSAQADYVNGQVIYVDGGLSTALMGLLPRPAEVPGGSGA